MVADGLLFTLRKHWKKSIFAAGLGFYGFHYGSKKFRDYLIRREYFLEAKKFGNEQCSPLDRPRRLYIILNPQAGNSNCKKLFQKNAAPIFYLAGVDVTYIQTDYEGHSKAIVNYFDPSFDGIVVAGGDGSFHEVVTGILRQPENSVIADKPVGIIPLGYQNNFVYRKLFGEPTNQVRSICQAAMSIVKKKTRKVSVMEIKTDSKSVYALSSLHFGNTQHIKQQTNTGRFWLFGPFRHYFTVLWKTIRDWPSTCSIDVNVQSPCCIEKHSSTQIPSRIPSFNLQTVSCQERHENNENLSKHAIHNINKDRSDRNLLNCSTDSLQTSFTTDSLSIYLQENEKGVYMTLQNFKFDQSRLNFISYGLKWIQNSFEYTPTDLCETMISSEITLLPADLEEMTYGIDGEIFDARPVTVSVCPRQINMFCMS